MAKHLRMGNYGSGYYAYNPIGGYGQHLGMGNYGSASGAYNPIGGCGDIRLILRLRIDDLSENRQREESMSSGVS